MADQKEQDTRKSVYPHELDEELKKELDKGYQGKKGEQEILKTFDMYHFFSRKDVIFVMSFIIAFLIFTLAVKLLPQIV